MERGLDVRTKLVQVTLATAASLGLVGCGFGGGGEIRVSDPSAETTAAPADTAAPAACEYSWSMAGLGHGGNRLDENGVPAEDRGATGEQSARDSLDASLDALLADPQIMAGGLNEILGLTGDDAYTAADLVDENGCATPEAVEGKGRIKGVLLTADVTAGEVPASGYNTGVDASGELVTSAAPGITGDRSGVMVDFRDNSGKKDFALMDRCRNFVFFGGRPQLPHGPTDNDIPQPGTTVPSPETTVGVRGKNDPRTVPAGDVNVTRDSDHTPGDEWGVGQGSAGAPIDNDGYGNGQNRPETPPAAPDVTSSPSTTEGRGPASTSPAPTITSPPVTFNPGSTPPTSSPNSTPVTRP